MFADHQATSSNKPPTWSIRSLKLAWARLVDWIPGKNRSEASYEVMRTRLVAGAALAILILCPPISVLILVVEGGASNVANWVPAFYILLTLCAIFVMRVTSSYRATAWILLVGACLAVFTMGLAAGTIHFMAEPWLPALVLITAFILGRRAAFVITALLIVELSVVHVLDTIGLLKLSVDLNGAWSLPLVVTALVFTAYFARIYENVRRKALDTAHEAIEKERRALEQLENMHQQMLHASRLAGMAEVATGVLHNVGNGLTSVNVSAGLLTETLSKSKLGSLQKLADLLNGQDDWARFFNETVQGKKVPQFVTMLAKQLRDEHRDVLAEVDTLRNRLNRVNDVLDMQQQFAKYEGIKEKVRVQDLIEKVMRLQETAFVRHKIDFSCSLEPLPETMLDKHRFVHILANLLANAKDATSGQERPRVRLKLERLDSDRFQLEVSDNGVGIQPENLSKIFAYGFTTKETGHGYGLHGSANAATEMGGELSCSSAGIGQGARFTLMLPFDAPH